MSNSDGKSLFSGKIKTRSNRMLIRVPVLFGSPTWSEFISASGKASTLKGMGGEVLRKS
jgi:hypothetical protein